jgi:hypothetical protein
MSNERLKALYAFLTDRRESIRKQKTDKTISKDRLQKLNDIDICIGICTTAVDTLLKEHKPSGGNFGPQRVCDDTDGPGGTATLYNRSWRHDKNAEPDVCSPNTDIDPLCSPGSAASMQRK